MIVKELLVWEILGMLEDLKTSGCDFRDENRVVKLSL